MDLNQILLFFSLFGAIQGFLIAVMLLWKTGWRSLRQRLLVFLFLSASAAVLLVAMVNSGLVTQQPLIQSAEGLINLCVGPVFLHYVILYAKLQYRFRWYLLFYVPAALFVIYLMFQLPDGLWGLWPEQLLPFYFQGHILVVGYFYWKDIKNRKAKTIDWPGLLLGLFVIVMVAQWLRYLLPNRLPFTMIVPFALTLGFWSITLYGFVKSVIREKPNQRTRNPHSNDQGRLVQQIRQIVETERAYLDPNLTQHQLASRLNIHPNQLSAIFTEHLQASFNQYINQYRVQRAQELLLDPAFDHLSVEGIGLEAGFKTRSVFYKAFKEKVGQTPAAFRTTTGTK